MLVFEERGKPEFPEKNLSEQSREPTNSAHIWRRVRESNPGHIGGRRALSPLHQPCSPTPTLLPHTNPAPPDPDPNKSTAWTAVSNPIYNEVRVVPNEFKSNPANPTHELGFPKPEHKSTMNSVFKSSKSTSEIQEENLPTVLSSISKASKWHNSQSIRFQARGFMVATECMPSGSNTVTYPRFS